MAWKDLPLFFFSWIHFEALCAFFDQKFLPVSVDGVEVPLPYCRVQHENVSTNTEEECYDEALDRVANEAQRRLHGDAIDAVFTRVYRRLNSLFFTGLQILFALVSAFVLIGIVPGTAYAHVNHLHVVMGAAVLGGQFFLSLGFARAVSSPSFREREYGFETTEKLFYVWVAFTVTLPVLGLWLVLSKDRVYPMEGWIWLSLVLYILALLFSWIGYVVAKSARDLDRNHG